MNLSRIPCKSNPMPIYTIPDTEPIYFKMPLTIKAINGTTTIKIKKASGNPSDPQMSGSVDGGETWTAYNFPTNSTNDVTYAELTDGQTLQLKANMSEPNGWSAGKYFKFVTSTNNKGTIELYGNIKSLINNSDTLICSSQFGQLFNGCSNIVDASKLVIPFTTLTDDCYRSMFYGCSALSTAPILPATQYVNNSDKTGYDWMFNGCGALKFVEFGLTSWSSIKPSNWFGGSSSTYFIKTQSLILDFIPSDFKVLNRINGKLYYAKAADGHSVGDEYIETDPYAWYYQ